MSVKCGSREERRDERRDEKRGERSGAGGDKCLDSGFRDNSHNGRHPQYTGSKRDEASLSGKSLLHLQM